MSTVQILDGGVLLTVDASDPRAPAVVPPQPSAPPVVPGTAILDALSPEQAAKADVRDLIRIGAAADVNTVKSKIKRVAAAAGTTPDALRSAAGGA